MQQSKKTSTREYGVSEVIGAVLLISIGVTAAAVIGAAVLSQPTPAKIPALDAIISSTGHTIQIYHNGGDTLQSASYTDPCRWNGGTISERDGFLLAVLVHR